MSIEIRLLKTLEECDQFQKVERLIWGGDDEGIVPTHVLITLARNGGLVMGAFAPDGPLQTGGLVGIVAGWLGSAIPPGESVARVKFCSHMAGVLPGWQRRHVGMRLKLAQRDWVLEHGFTDWMTWTYDPLYRANGVFNIHRLGAVSRTYIRDLYGEMTDVLNAGGPSDRCQVDWWLRSERATSAVARASESGAQPQVATMPPVLTANNHAAARYPGLRVLGARSCGTFRQPLGETFVADGRPVAVPIPDDIAALRRHDRALALEWRYYVRSVLEEAYAAGYVMVDCVHIAGQDWCYVLLPAGR